MTDFRNFRLQNQHARVYNTSGSGSDQRPTRCSLAQAEAERQRIHRWQPQVAGELPLRRKSVSCVGSLTWHQYQYQYTSTLIASRIAEPPNQNRFNGLTLLAYLNYTDTDAMLKILRKTHSYASTVTPRPLGEDLEFASFWSQVSQQVA